MIYQLFILARGQKCIYHACWNQAKPVVDLQATTKLLLGVVMTLMSFTKQISPKAADGKVLRSQGFVSYVTPSYKLHALETATGYRLILTTDPTVADQQETLFHIYRLLVDEVIKQPMYQLGESATSCTQFLDKVHKFIETLPNFATLP
eukprot:NODE_22863_length_691_cov_3.381206.p1 GENE.NODE_22863_length_691_cov_3.381206~~NODE_22863_length_691_cov_3.381206.p1  ORF type:complete len:149 (+),score=50.25 NODE_22863_length_691_cov_3.381206:135-581(+)